MIAWHIILWLCIDSPDTDMLYLTPDPWHLIFDTGTWHVITWHLIPDTWHLIYDTWQLTCYHSLDMLSHGTSTLGLMLWHLIGYYYTWHLLSLDTWELTCYHSLDMLSHDTSTLDPMLWHLTGYYYTWHLYYIAYSRLSLLRRLSMIITLLPDIWYSWTLVLLNSCILEPQKWGDFWHYAPDIILLLIPIIG